MWAYSFMQNALLAGLMVAVVCGVVSVFVILRRTGFAAHALGHMSLTGAAGAALLGFPSLLGQLLLNSLAAVVMGLLGDKVKKNDLAVGVVLTFVLGLGAYFLFLFQNNYAGSVMSILFGNIFAVSNSQLWGLLILGISVLALLMIISRPLIFASIDPVVAASRNVPLRLLSVIFFLILAVTVSMACQVVGVLLVFVLLIIPGAIGMQWGESIYGIVALSVMSAVAAVVVALYVSYQFDLPASFCITMLLCAGYFIGLIKNYVVKS
ncbi:MAG TPA: ABC transporter permease [Neisseriales bacterium]|nr:metal ABC transporter permease [Burkholderiales bacterium]HCY39695.1 ABC transporter permease [Neisseriales bacterium]